MSKNWTELAEKAIDKVFSDTSVSIEETLSEMEGLRSFIDSKIAALKSDIKKRDAR